jgi:adenosylhomocysteinase
MSAPATKFKVADLSLAAFGRKEIELAEVRENTLNWPLI